MKKLLLAAMTFSLAFSIYATEDQSAKGKCDKLESGLKRAPVAKVDDSKKPAKKSKDQAKKV